MMEFTKDKAIYLQLSEHICERILKNEWKIGERVPSVREFAVEVEVNPNTVTKTYQHLEDLCIIEKQRGLGCFVSAGAAGTISELRRRDFIDNTVPKIAKELMLLAISLPEFIEAINQATLAQKISKKEIL